jgi:hypothetical protein
MGRISWREGMELAEREAWRTKGKEHHNLFVYGRFIPWVLGAAVLGALGLGAKWAWDRTIGALGSNTDTAPGAIAHSGVPAWIWIGAVVLVIVSVLAIRGRPGYARQLSTIALIGFGLALVWLAFGAFVIGTL